MAARAWLHRKYKLGPADLYWTARSDGLYDLVRIPVTKLEARRRVRTGRPRQIQQARWVS